MTSSLPSALPRVDRFLLHSVLPLVPASEQPDWLRCWQAELWHRHHPRSGAAHSAVDLYPGLIRDAVWLRHESWRRASAGTAVLCLLALTALSFAALVPLLPYFSDLHAMLRFLVVQSSRFLVEATLTTIVGFAIAARVTEHAAPHAQRLRWRAHLFFSGKLVLLQILAYLLSLDLTHFLYAAHPFTAEILQPQVCTIFALLGLRWSFDDQDTRCRRCLRSLSAPMRVGRPSWNFLDSNGTHLVCRDGHGLLSVPEIETSWRRSSEWIAQ